MLAVTGDRVSSGGQQRKLRPALASTEYDSLHNRHAVSRDLIPRGVEGRRDLRRDGQGRLDFQRPTIQFAPPAFPPGTSSSIPGMAARRAAVRVRRSRPRADVIQRGQQPRLALEAGQAVRLMRHRFGEKLQGHIAPELGVGRPIHLAHAAFADLGGDAVMGDRLLRAHFSPHAPRSLSHVASRSSGSTRVSPTTVMKLACRRCPARQHVQV